MFFLFVRKVEARKQAKKDEQTLLNNYDCSLCGAKFGEPDDLGNSTTQWSHTIVVNGTLQPETIWPIYGSLSEILLLNSI